MVVSYFSKEFEKRKKAIKILILGAYRPSSFLGRLRNSKTCLINHKYLETKLVEDFPDTPRLHNNPDIHFSLKSKHLIKNWAEALIFVFFGGGADNSGVATELEFTCLTVQDKLDRSLVLSEKGLALSTLTKGSIRIHKIDADNFHNDTYLCDIAIGYLTNYVLQLYWSLI